MATPYIFLHASAYPPCHWNFVPDRQSQPPRTLNNELWTAMTKIYNQSMVERQHQNDSNELSKTATADNISKMRPDVKELCRPLPSKFENAARVTVLKIKKGFLQKVDNLAKNLETIPEEDVSITTQPPQRQTEREWRQSKQAVSNARYYHEFLQDDTDIIETSFRKRLEEIYDAYYHFICRSNRPRLAQLSRMDKEVTDHVARVAYAKQQLKFDVTQLRTFLREQLFDQYCLMRDTPMEKKDETWLQYGRCLSSGTEIGDREVEGRLDRMIDESGLDPTWVMDRIEDYYNGDDHIGRWQRLVKGRHWNELAAKFTVDSQQLEKMNSTIDGGRSRKCNIVSNISNSKRQFFKRVDGAQDFELSETALRMDGEDERASNPSPTISISPVNEVMC